MDGNNNNEFPQGEPGQGSGGGNNNGGNNGGSEEVLDNSRPAVAAAPAKTLVLIVLGLLFVGIVVKSLFFSAKPDIVVKQRKENVVPQEAPVNIKPSDLPTPPSFASVPSAPPPPPPPAPQAMTPPPPPQITARTGPTNEQLKARIHAPMLLASSSATQGGSSDNANGVAGKKPAPSDPNSTWAQSVEGTKAETITATQVKNLNRTILQGKFIPGVLESAIDSSLPAPIRAIVSHDVYAESGRIILIPKGSRIIGVYNSSLRRGQARVFIIWTRIIRPDGIDVAIDSPGVDALGRAGMGGEVDNKYFEAFSTAILTSSIDVAVAAIGDALFGNQNQTSTESPGGGTTVNSSPTSTAMQTAIQNIGTVGQTIVNNTVNLEPVIHIDQGQQINIFVNKDVVFPSDMIGNGAGIIP